MPRHHRPGSAARKKEGGARSPNPFDALAALKKGSLKAAPERPGNTPPPTEPTAPAAEPPDAHDLALLRQALAGVAPLSAVDRAEIEAPRPAPVPRKRAAEADEAPAVVRRGSHDPLRAAYADVTPLADTGRVELNRRMHRRSSAPAQEPVADKTALAAGELPPVILPDETEVADPTALFRLATRGAHRVDSGGRVELAVDTPAPKPLKREADERDALNESLAAPLTFEDRLDMGDEAAFLRPGLPRRVLSDLRRGRWVLQGEIDLHGLTRDEARDALARFLHASLAQGKRCIRVIHGKGLGSPGRVAILKQLSRGWLAQREEILAFCQAGPHDGGGGALLVLIRAQAGARQ